MRQKVRGGQKIKTCDRMKKWLNMINEKDFCGIAIHKNRWGKNRLRFRQRHKRYVIHDWRNFNRKLMLNMNFNYFVNILLAEKLSGHLRCNCFFLQLQIKNNLFRTPLPRIQNGKGYFILPSLCGLPFLLRFSSLLLSRFL